MQQETDISKKRNLLSIFANTFFILMFLCAAAFAVYVINLSILPLNYSIILCAALLVLTALIFIIFIRKRSETKEKHRKAKDISAIIICIVMITLLAFLTWYFAVFADSLNKVNEKVSHATLSVRVLKDSGYEKINDLDGVSIGINKGIDEKNTDYAVQQLKEKLEDGLNIVEYNDYKAQIEALYNGEVGAVIMNESIVTTLNDLYEGFVDDTEIIISLKHDTTEAEISENDLTTKAFNVYLSGGDNYGEIEENGRSDVNIIANVNPVTKNVVLINVPRDYYVALDGDADKMDKLTHAGVYGIECSMDTVASLLDTPIDYYVKVNFSSVAQIIDALGGINVYSPMTFILDDDDRTRYFYYEGYNEMSGKMAVRFCREREQMLQGDIDRGKNQENVIKAIIEKATSPAIITNFSGVLNAITDNCITNVSTDSIMSLIQMQLADMSSWNITMYTLSGYDDSGYTYTGGSEELYVMAPEVDTIETAKLLLRNNMLMPDDKALNIPDTATLVQNQKKSE